MAGYERQNTDYEVEVDGEIIPNRRIHIRRSLYPRREGEENDSIEQMVSSDCRLGVSDRRIVSERREKASKRVNKEDDTFNEDPECMKHRLDMLRETGSYLV